jgi:hypothetical protein
MISLAKKNQYPPSCCGVVNMLHLSGEELDTGTVVVMEC